MYSVIIILLLFCRLSVDSVHNLEIYVAIPGKLCISIYISATYFAISSKALHSGIHFGNL